MALKCILLLLCFIQAIRSWDGCVMPPMECPNINITYWLYTRETPEDNPHQLYAMDDDSILSAPWVEGAPIKILIHGYTGHRDFSPNTEIRPAYMKCCDYNVISVDYNPIALEPCYISAAHNIQLVGKCTAQLIDSLVLNHGFELNRFHVIGFSLGGQTAGAISNYLECGILDRITGLDPAMPLFVTSSKTKKLDSDDAKFVDVLHTNALVKGKLEQSGDIDFYANGGLTQPGCVNQPNQTKSGCDHARAPAYFAESILTDVGFYGTKCPSWIAYMIGWCEITGYDEEVLFGEYVPLDASGFYFFQTNSESPFARGSNKNQPADHSSNRLDDENVYPYLYPPTTLERMVAENMKDASL